MNSMKSPAEFRLTCTRCVMDTSDPEISFDADGVCSHCRNFERNIKPHWFPDEEGARRLDALVKAIRNAGRRREYDCIIGLSGGVDSSYLAYQAKQHGLRPLAVHVDAGWNSELAVKNIENLVKTLDIDLFTHVVDWDEMRDLQLAFFRAGVANLDVPQDHAFTAAVFAYAARNNIRYVLSGGNYATESILPRAWGYNAMDLRHLTAIHKRYGKVRLRTFPKVNFFQYYVYYPRILGMRTVRPLNLMPYNKAAAMRILEDQVGWRYYGGKHYESRFTKFFQAHYLPTKFGYDKRRAHLSSLIVSGQMTREEALDELAKPLYSSLELQEDKLFFIKKLGITETEYASVMAQPAKTYLDYPSNEWMFRWKDTIKAKLRARTSQP